MNIKDLPITLGGSVQGELLIFQSEDEVKEFFCMLSFEPEKLEQYGITVDKEYEEGSEDDFEWICEYHNNALLAPVLDPNPFMGYERESMSVVQSVWCYNKTNLTLNEEVFTGFPYVMYMYIDKCWDRIGDSEIDFCYGVELAKMNNTHNLKSALSNYKEQWTNRLQKHLDFEELRDNDFKNKSGGDF